MLLDCMQHYYNCILIILHLLICLFPVHFTQNIFINELEGGDRSKAMNRLRVPPLTEREVSCMHCSNHVCFIKRKCL